MAHVFPAGPYLRALPTMSGSKAYSQAFVAHRMEMPVYPAHLCHRHHSMITFLGLRWWVG